MIRIEISAAAYAALCDGVPEARRLPALESNRKAAGGRT